MTSMANIASLNLDFGISEEEKDLDEAEGKLYFI
jgi:hypothetical protein